LQADERVGFGHDVNGRGAALAEDNEFVRINDEAAADDDWQFVAVGAEFAEGVAAGEFWHVDVEQQGVDLLVSLFDDFERLLAIGGFEDFVAQEAEHVDGDVADRGFVVNDENAPAVGFGGGGPGWGDGFGFGDCFLEVTAHEAREKDAELGAAIDFTVEFDPAAVLLDDLLGGCETEACSFAGFLGGEEGFEDALAVFRGDAAAVVAHGDDDKGGGASFGVGGVGAAGVLDFKLDDSASFGEGVAGVDAEVEEDLFDLGAVAHDAGGCIGGLGADADSGVDAMAEEALDVGDDATHVSGFLFQSAAPRVAEELFDEFGGAGGGLACALEAGFDLRFVAVRGEFGEGDVAVDSGEEVVEVMGDAAGDEAEGAHFLGFAELALEEGDLRMVAEDPDLTDDGAGFRDHGQGLEFHLDGRGGRQFSRDLATVGRGLGELFEPSLFVLFGDEAFVKEGGETFAVATDEAFQGFAEEGVEFFVGGDDGSVGVDDGHAFVAGGEKALHGAERLSDKAFGVLEALSGLAGVFFGGGEGLMLLGEEEIDFGADLEEGFGEPVGGFVFGRQAFEKAAGAVHGGSGGIEDPAADQVSGQEDAAAEEDAGIAKEPAQWLAHHFGGTHGWEEAEEPERTEETKAHGLHRRGEGILRGEWLQCTGWGGRESG
jgi:hypothetical protein